MNRETTLITFASLFKLSVKCPCVLYSMSQMNIFDIYIHALLPVLISWLLEFKRQLLTYEGTLIRFRLKVNKNNHI